MFINEETNKSKISISVYIGLIIFIILSGIFKIADHRKELKLEQSSLLKYKEYTVRINNNSKLDIKKDKTILLKKYGLLVLNDSLINDIEINKLKNFSLSSNKVIYGKITKNEFIFINRDKVNNEGIKRFLKYIYSRKDTLSLKESQKENILELAEKEFHRDMTSYVSPEIIEIQKKIKKEEKINTCPSGFSFDNKTNKCTKEISEQKIEQPKIKEIGSQDSFQNFQQELIKWLEGSLGKILALFAFMSGIIIYAFTQKASVLFLSIFTGILINFASMFLSTLF